MSNILRYSDASWLEPSWRHEGSIMWSPHDGFGVPLWGALMTSQGLHMMEPSWQHESFFMWSPNDIRRAPHDGALMMKWQETSHTIMRDPSCEALMTAWWSPHDGMIRKYQCHHEGSIMLSTNDGISAPSWGALIMEWRFHHLEPSW